MALPHLVVEALYRSRAYAVGPAQPASFPLPSLPAQESDPVPLSRERHAYLQQVEEWYDELKAEGGKPLKLMERPDVQEAMRVVCQCIKECRPAS